MFVALLRYRPRSIQFWLTWLVVACILPAALGAMFLLVRFYEQERSNLDTANIGMARALMQVVDGELRGATSVLEVMTKSASLLAGDFAAFQVRAEHALAATSGNNIVLMTPDGAEIINTLKPYGTPLPTSRSPVLGRVFETGQPSVSDLFVGRVTGKPTVAIQVPVLVDGRVKYVLAMGYFPGRLTEILLQQKVPVGWVAAIYDRNGIIIARTLAAEKFVGKPGAAEAVRRVSEVTEDALDTATVEGIQVRAVFSRSAFSGWAVVTALPTEIATAPLTRSLYWSAAIALITLLLGTVFARRIGQLIARSIGALAEPAQSLGTGDIIASPTAEVLEVDALRRVLLNAAHLIEQRALERDAARDGERRMIIEAEAAAKANRAKSVFLAALSHELRTPLHGLLGYAGLLRTEGDLTVRQTNRIEAMLGAGQHLLDMINSVLDLSQIEADRMELQPAVVELNALAQVCIDIVRPAADTKKIALLLVPAKPVWMLADPTRVRQVLVNLLGNAIKFTPVGKIEMRLRPTGSHIRIEVADNGAGVPVKHRDKLFQMFERLDSEKLRAVEGAGLGLALSTRLATLMGGRLGYDDNPMGGSIFWLDLPLGVAAEAPSDDVSVSSEVTDATIPSERLRVLIVDDVLMNRDIASAFLRAAGHDATCAECGADAIAAVASTDFDVVLMDVRMPEMDGLEATRCIRALEGSRGRVPIVGLTAQAFAEQVAECRRAGMDRHLSKPFDQNAVLTVIMEAIADGHRREVGPGLDQIPAP